MTAVSGSLGASLWLANAWQSFRSSLQSSSRGPTIQDFLDQGAALADAFATISQNATTGFASLAAQAAQDRVQAQIAALKKQLAAASGTGSSVDITA
jgi:hypothetical protein